MFSGQNTVTPDDIYSLFNSTTGNYAEIKIDSYQNNKVILELNGQKGWLVASERFAYFPGWKANLDGKNLEMLRANNIVTAVYLNGENGRLEFSYAPSSYKTGRLITVIAVIFLIAYFSYFAYAKLKSKNKLGDENQA